MLLLKSAFSNSMYSLHMDAGTLLSRIRTSYSSIIIIKVSSNFLLIIDIAAAITALVGNVADGNCSRYSSTTSVCRLSITWLLSLVLL